MVFSHVKDVRTLVALSLVNTVWRGASKVASSMPTSLQFSTEMLHWYMKGARHGNTECERILGCLYFHGVVVERNVDTALRYYERAAAQGDACGQDGVGCCHDKKGRYDEAFKWFTKSVAQGYANAECNLGILYEFGRGVTKDISKAIEWYAKAAEKGCARAAKALRRLTPAA